MECTAYNRWFDVLREQSKDIVVKDCETTVDAKLFDEMMINYSLLSPPVQAKVRPVVERIVARTIRHCVAVVSAGRTIDQSIELASLFAVIWNEIADWLGTLAALNGHAEFTIENDFLLIERVIFDLLPNAADGLSYKDFKGKVLDDCAPTQPFSSNMLDKATFIKRQISQNYRLWLGYLTKRYKDPEKARDLLQDACARALAHIDQFDYSPDEAQGASEKLFGGWFMRLLTNLAIDQYRKTRKPLSLTCEITDHDLYLLPATSNPESDADASMQLKVVSETVAHFTPPQRAAFDCIVSGISYQEMADTRGIPVNSICTGATGVRKKLRKAFGE